MSKGEEKKKERFFHQCQRGRLLEMLSLMAKEEHLRQQQGKEGNKSVRCREGRAVETGLFKEAEAAKGELRSSINQGADEIKERE